ncbi:hypothetical protein TL16_g02811 [Triparma laevis f. inornata]|uniref:Exportin-T n=1 Tax=Triparma laevis f. inornata TaxID=1714386 RepID=A0A9W6ZZJ8_9STRA|nr:hypothetical protein TL16_g02811 [Triparma laevis f. inornata]
MDHVVDHDQLRNLILSDYSRHTSPNKNSTDNSSSYLSTLHLNPVISLPLCLPLLNVNENWLVQFYSLRMMTWCLNSLSSSSSSEIIRKKITSYIPTLLPSHPPPVYLLNILSLTLALLIKHTYPTVWSHPFLYLTSLLSSQNSVLNSEIYCRTLKMLVQELVYDVTGEEVGEGDRRRDERVRDEMRGGKGEGGGSDVESIFRGLLQLIQTSPHPHLQHLSLTTLKLYINWSSITLVMSSPCLHVILSCLEREGLKEEACDCLGEIVNKGMGEEEKLNVLEGLNLIQVFNSTFKTSPSSLSTHTKLTSIINSVGIQLISISESPNPPISTKAGSMMNSWMELILKTFVHDSIIVSGEVLNVLSRWTMCLGKQVGKGRGEKMGGFWAEEYLVKVLSCVFRQMQYQKGYDFNQKENLPELVSVFDSQTLAVEEDDDDEEIYRQEVRKLYAKIVRWQPDQAVQMIGATLGRLPVQLSGSEFEVAEAALRLVFHFQEGLSSKMAKMIGNGGGEKGKIQPKPGSGLKFIGG